MKNSALLDSFFESYIETALWSSTDFDGNPLDDDYSIADFDQESLERLKAECNDFIESHSDILYEIDNSWEEIAHDFWLTRCGHGAGFWDGDYEKPYDKQLTDAAKAYGNVDLVVNDGVIYSY